MTEPMQKSFYFMAGLPRSGSTLLSAILNQNPRFYSGPSSPVTGLMLLMEQALSQDELFRAHPKPNQANQIIANLLPQYYSDIDKSVIFDKNRSWVNRLHYIEGYFGLTPKVICPVRNLDEILTSFISMHRRNPYEVNGKINFMDEMLIKSNIPLTDDNRCEFLVSENGILGQSYTGIRDALMKGQQSFMHFVEYDDLTNSPEETVKKIYDFLEEEYYKHDFNNLVNINSEDDSSVYGIIDMHDVRKTISRTSANPQEILSKDILSRCQNLEFWRDLNQVVNTEDLEELNNENSEEDLNSENNENQTLIGA
jgi:sulfotransferase